MKPRARREAAILVQVVSLVFAMAAAPERSWAVLIDLGNAVRDTDNGLDWLDLTETQGLFYEDVAGGAGGFLADGWSIATASELCLFFATHAVAHSPCPSVGSTTAPGNGNETLIDLLGPTLVGPVSKEVDAAYDNGQPLHGFAFIFYRSDTNESQTGVFDNNSPQTLFSGVWLNRAVPEPGSALLVLVGFAVLVAGGRRPAAEGRPSA